MSKEIVSTRRVKRRGNRIWLFAGIGLLLILMIGYLITSMYYRSHFYSHTKINGVSTSGMTVKEAEEAISSQVKTYTLTIKGRNAVTDTIYGNKIDLHTEFDNALENAMKEQNGFAWPVSLLKSHSIKVKAMLKFDEVALNKQIKKLNCLKKDNNIKPENAHISTYGKNGYEIVPAEQGSMVDKQKLQDAVNNAVNSLSASLDLDKAGCYKEAEKDSKDAGLDKTVEELNKIAGARITYQFGSDTEVLDGNKISEWLSVDDNGKVKLDTKAIKEYVDYIGRTYNSFGRVRTFTTSYHKVIKVKGGDYGWWLDRVKETAELTDLIQNGKQQENREPAYFQTAQQYGKDDIGTTYVEVNLSAQHLFFYKEGKLMLQTDFVSGNVSQEFGTPVGTYPIQYKESDATLVGETYTTPVKYWMPFNHNIGLHDANWRDEFGKDIFLTRGSHGCINMPPKMAEKLFANVKRGIPVVVYKLKGTESYDPKVEQRILANIEAAKIAAKKEAAKLAADKAAQKKLEDAKQASSSKTVTPTPTPKPTPKPTPVPVKKAPKSN